MLNLGPFDLLVPVIVILVAIIYIPITFITLLRKSIKSPQLRTWSAFQQAWFARFWDFFGWGSRWLFAPDIEAVLSQAHGVVLDVGTGSGDWLYLFSPERNKKISKLLLLEPNRYFHPTLRRRAQKLGLSDKYEILDGGVEDLERIGIQKGTIDTITTIHVLCSVHSPQTSIEKLYQYLKPGGRWLVYEHIRIKNKSKIAAAIQAGVNTIWPFFFDDCSLTRDTEDMLLYTARVNTRRKKEELTWDYMMVTHLSPGTNPYIRPCSRAYSIQEDHPPIYVADVLPCRHVDPRDKRETFLDLERYRKCLTANFQEHTLFRALDMPRSQGP